MDGVLLIDVMLLMGFCFRDVWCCCCESSDYVHLKSTCVSFHNTKVIAFHLRNKEAKRQLDVT